MKEYQHKEKKKYFFFNLNTTANETCEYFVWRTNLKKKEKNTDKQSNVSEHSQISQKKFFKDLESFDSFKASVVRQNI